MSVTATMGSAEARSDTTCNGDIALIRVRGSGDRRAVDADLNRPGQAGNTGFQLTLDAASRQFRARAEVAGRSVNEFDLNYPALSTSYIKSDLRSVNLRDSAYLDSIRQGEDQLRALLQAKRTCATQQLVLIGYSQGALVIGNVLASLTTAERQDIDGVAMFGDARFDPADPAARGSYDPKRYGIAVPLQGKRQVGGLLGKRIRNYCYADDLVCQGLDRGVVDASIAGDTDTARTLLSQQTNAHARGYACNALIADELCRAHVDAGKKAAARDAGDYLADLLGLQRASSGVSELLDVAFVIDSTGSMSPYVTAVRSSVNEIVAAAGAPGVNAHFAVVDYKDVDQGDPYAAQVDVPFTADPAAIAAAMDSFSVSGGGDWPEAMLSGLMTSFRELSWRSGALKMAIVIADAPAKDPEPVTGFTIPATADVARRLDPVVITAVQTGSSTVTDQTMQDLAAASSGRVVASPDGGGVVDAIVASLEAATTIPVADAGGPYDAIVDRPVLFSAGNSFDPDGQLTTYEWDFEDDGTFDSVSEDPIAWTAFHAVGGGTARLRITDDDGNVVTASTEYNVRSPELDLGQPVTGVAFEGSGADDGLRWDPYASGGDGVLWYLVHDQDGELLAETGDTTLSPIDLLPGSRTVTVTAITVEGESAPSSPITVPSAAPAPSAPDPSRCADSPPLTFGDVEASSPHARAIACLARDGIVRGRTPTTFGPSAPVTRAQVALLITRVLAEHWLTSPASLPDRFSDDASPSAAAFDWLASLGIVTGYADGTVRPAEPVTRAQIAAFLVRTVDATSDPDLESPGPGFADDAGVHQAAIRAATAAGLVEGGEDGLFHPHASTRRDQMASLTLRLLRLLDSRSSGRS